MKWCYSTSVGYSSENLVFLKSEKKKIKSVNVFVFAVLFHVVYLYILHIKIQILF